MLVVQWVGSVPIQSEQIGSSQFKISICVMILINLHDIVFSEHNLKDDKSLY